MSNPDHTLVSAAPVATSLKHELRTPLNHIIGYCEMLGEEAVEGGYERFLPDLQRILEAGRALLAIVNDICDPARLPAYRANPGLLDHDVRTPLNQIIGYAEMLQEEARAGGCIALVGDLERIHRAARELLHRVVQNFQPVPDRRSPRGVDPGATTMFMRDRPAVQPKSTSPVGRILVADDDEGNRALLARRLQRLGHEVGLAVDGRDALAQLRRGGYDLVLLDIQMPELNGYQLLELMKTEPALAAVPAIVLSASDETARVARCIEMGAEDYLPKPFDSVVLRARIHACLEKRQLLERERRAFEALRKSQEALTAELAEAAGYVRSLLPAPLGDGPVRFDWRFVPSTQLGGDALGYHWLDERRLTVFLLDVCGHGVGAALLSVSVLNTLQNQSIPRVDFADPAAVLSALNRTFPMEKQNNMFFTIWYGVLDVVTRELRFACGGHPPAVLLGAAGGAAELLRAAGPIVGGFPGVRYSVGSVMLAPGSRVCVFSDGIYELERPDGSTVQLAEFVTELERTAPAGRLDALVAWATAIRAGGGFDDDVSILEFALTS